MALVTCHDVSFAYDGKTAVSDLNFTINSSDYLCVVGENGSGKSTLIKGLLHLMAPQQGSIVLGEGLQHKEIGYLPQQTPAQKDFPASVYEVVLSGCLGALGWSPFFSRVDKALAEQNMARFDIVSLRNRCYRELSGGQQQRVLLARALCAGKRLLLLDEPVAGLDPLATHELYRIIETMNKETGLTIVMVSHDIHCAVDYASHILHLRNRQIYFGSTQDYLQSAVGRLFLEGAANA